MDRPKWAAATKITDFQRYHLSGDLNQTLQGQVDTRIGQFEMSATQEELQQQLEEERAQSKQMMEEAELMKIQHKLDAERLKQKQWQTVMDQLKEAKEHAQKEHERFLGELKDITGASKRNTAKDVLEWFKAQTDKLHEEPTESEEQTKARLEKEARDREIKELQLQQENIAQKLAELTGEPPRVVTHTHGTNEPNPSLLQQLRDTLTGRKEEDPNKALLKALVTAQNKTAGEGGTNTLKAGLTAGLLEAGGHSMADWLGNLNRQEEGESEIARLALTGEGEAHRGVKTRSGILDKATTNIQEKQVWPQQNLGEDWADEDVEFKQIKFEHLVAG